MPPTTATLATRRQRLFVDGLATVDACDAHHEDELAGLLRQAFVLSVHCPLTAETRHLVNADTLELLPRGNRRRALLGEPLRNIVNCAS